MQDIRLLAAVVTARSSSSGWLAETGRIAEACICRVRITNTQPHQSVTQLLEHPVQDSVLKTRSGRENTKSFVLFELDRSFCMAYICMHAASIGYFSCHNVF